MVGPTIFVASTPIAMGTAVQTTLRPEERRFSVPALVLALIEAAAALALLVSLLGR
jgi:hypothetical protein